jgi:predicted DNA-binding transcriptional regulator YafY
VTDVGLAFETGSVEYNPGAHTKTMKPGRLARRSLRMPSTRPPLRRIAWTLNQLRAGQPLTASRVAREFGCTIRTAYCDFDFLRDDWHAPMEYDRTAGTYRLTEPTAPLPPVTVTRGELVALFFAEKVLAQYRGTPYESDLTSAFRKIQSLLMDQIQVLPDRVLSYLSLDLGPLPQGDPRVFQKAVEALARRRRLLVHYRSMSSGHALDRIIEPYRVFNLKGDWYVAAFDHRRGDVRDFALHRIRRAVLTEESFEPDPGFDFKAYMAAAFSIEKGARPVNVAIRFAPRQARWIRERRWHRSARVQERLDGGCVLRMRVASTSELVRWVSQFGPEAEVLAPKRLRLEVAHRLARALALYKARSGTTERRKEAARAGA